MNGTGKTPIEAIANVGKPQKESKIIMNYRCHRLISQVMMEPITPY